MIKKGVALIWAVVLSGVMLMVSGAIVSYILKESRFVMSMEQSSAAYFGARTGMEWALHRISEQGQQGGEQPEETETVVFFIEDIGESEEVRVEVTIEREEDGGHRIIGTGSSNQTIRSLEYYHNPYPFSRVLIDENPPDTLVGDNTESFELQFDFWTENEFPDTEVFFGLEGEEGHIRTSFNSLLPQVELESDPQQHGERGIIDFVDGVDIYSDTNRRQKYNFRANLYYIKDTVATLTILMMDPNDFGIYDCVGRESIDVNAIDFENLEQLSVGVGNEDYSITLESELVGTRFVQGIKIEGSNGSMHIGNVVMRKPFPIVPTVTIGNQTWMQYNMNVGTQVPGTQVQSLGEKYCYNDDPDNCSRDKYGALYRWNTAMLIDSYDAGEEGAQGICPDGFYIPTDADWHELENFLATGSCLADRAGWDCQPAGTSLKKEGWSGFEGPLGGNVTGLGGFFQNITDWAFFWTSSKREGPGEVWRRSLRESETKIDRRWSPHTLGYSVRCIMETD